jgi:Xaa-Pro aminopeptidase
MINAPQATTTLSPIPARLTRLRDVLRQHQLDAILISQPDNRRYLSGFTGSSGWLLISADQALLATDFRYYDQVMLESPDFALVQIKMKFADVLRGMIEQAGARRVGFEADHATYDGVQEWCEAVPDCEWAPTKGLVVGLRALKDASELAAMRAAIALADEALAQALPQMRPGMTELEVSWIIESYMRTRGAEGVAFELIVAGGPNAARPHARASDRPLRAGEPIVIDMGARLNGYCSDLTRTFCLGQPNEPERFWEVYNTVLRAQTAAEVALRPGMTGQEGDAVARDLITAAGYGEAFGHGLGHGVGLAVHEEPRLSRVNLSPLIAGSLVTVEPGIYLPGWGGVRIEDVVLITDSGVEVLTRAPKEPILQG